MIRKTTLILTLAGCMALTACEETNCIRNERSMVTFNLYQEGTLQAMAFDSLTVTAVNTDSILINRDLKVSTFSLPMNFVGEQTTYILHYTKDLRDTITLKHTNYEHFTSMDCGTAIYHHVNEASITKHVLDSLAIKNPEITETDANHIHLFVK